MDEAWEILDWGRPEYPIHPVCYRICARRLLGCIYDRLSVSLGEEDLTPSIVLTLMSGEEIQVPYQHFSRMYASCDLTRYACCALGHKQTVSLSLTVSSGGQLNVGHTLGRYTLYGDFRAAVCGSRILVTMMASEIYIGTMRPIAVEYYRCGERFYQGTIFRYPGMGTIQFPLLRVWRVTAPAATIWRAS